MNLKNLNLSVDGFEELKSDELINTSGGSFSWQRYWDYIQGRLEQLSQEELNYFQSYYPVGGNG